MMDWFDGVVLAICVGFFALAAFGMIDNVIHGLPAVVEVSW